MAWLTYSSVYQWARRGFVPAAGQRSHKRGGIGQPLFSERQVTYVGTQRALSWFDRNKSVAYRQQPDSIFVGGVRYVRG